MTVFFDFLGKTAWTAWIMLFRENIIRNMPVFLEHKNAVTNGNSVHFTVQMKNRSGNDAWLQINASCIGVSGGRSGVPGHLY